MSMLRTEMIEAIIKAKGYSKSWAERRRNKLNKMTYQEVEAEYDRVVGGEAEQSPKAEADLVKETGNAVNEWIAGRLPPAPATFATPNGAITIVINGNITNFVVKGGEE